VISKLGKQFQWLNKNHFPTFDFHFKFSKGISEVFTTACKVVLTIDAFFLHFIFPKWISRQLI